MKKIILAILMFVGLTGTAFAANPNRLTAVFAGGCFWSTQKAMDHVPGVVSTRAGFMGGTKKNPSYQDVTWGSTGHLEAVEVIYDPTKVSYDQLLTAYWHSTDPTDPSGVICDHGPNYHTAIFTYSDDQYGKAVASKAAVQKQLNKPVVTQVIKASSVALPFYAAEAYHQHYWQTHADAYDGYYRGCGRGPALKKLWG
ncbi:MAG: peptide-methionine (S)-S-oxide reductase MsrA [Asticcacaulis sp.]|nr:peptide-methionine (S)-S-oxide reductase MsrA [Asticcacaulis sp.]